MARTRALSRLGVDAVMLVTPYYNKPPQEGLYRHFMAAADASAVPIILYNVPSRTAVDLLPSTIARLARHPRIVAIKEATGSLSRAREIVSTCPAEFTLLSGDDATAVELMGVGARGVISVTANVAPRRMHEACKAALAGDLVTARAIDASLQPLHKDLFVEANPDTRQVGGGENGPHRERNPPTIGRTGGCAPRNRAACDAGRRSYS